MALFLRPPAFERPHPVLIDTQRRFYVVRTAPEPGRSVDEHDNDMVATPITSTAASAARNRAVRHRWAGGAVDAARSRARAGWLYDVSPTGCT